MVESSQESAIGKAQFAILKPVCMSLMRNRDKNSLNEFRKEIDSLSQLSPKLVEYVLYPLRMTLQESMSLDRQNEGLAESTMFNVGVVLSKTCLSSEKTFHELLTLFSVMIDRSVPTLTEPSDYPSFNGRGLRSEEMTCCVLNTMKTLFLSSSSSVLRTLYENLQTLGYTISVLKGLIMDKWAESGNPCVITALRTLISISGTNSGQWIQQNAKGSGVDNIGKGSSGHNFTPFIPGIAVTLAKLATETSKGKSIVILSILGWSHYVAMVMSSDSATTPANKNQELYVERSKEWLKTTDEKLGKLSSRIAGLVTNQDWQIRQSLCTWASTLIEHCYRSLPIAIGPVIETIISLSTDEYETVSSNAKKVIELCSSLMTSSSGETEFMSLVEDKLYNLATELPDLIRKTDERKTFTILQLFHGYLNILGSRVCHVTSSIQYISRIITVLAETVQISQTPSIVPVNGQSDLLDSEECDNELWTPPISFVHLREDRTINLIQSICKTLGERSQLDILLDYIVYQRILPIENTRSEHLLLLQWIVKGVGQATPLENMINGLLQLKDDNDLSQCSRCFILNILNDSAQVIGEERFKYYLQRVIVLVMEETGSDDPLVVNTGIRCLRGIARCLGHKGVASLVSYCSDYLIHHVSVRLLHCTSLMSGCHILTAIVMCSSYNMLLMLSDCQESLLLSLDHGYGVSQCWKVLYHLAKRLPEWIRIETTPTIQDTPTDQDTPTTTTDTLVDESMINDNDITKDEDIREYFLQYHKQKEEEQPVMDDDNEAIVEDDVPKAKATPPAIRSAVDIIRYSVHYMSGEDPMIRMTVLDTLHLVLMALKNTMDTKTNYDSEVHEVWSSFVHRLVDTNIPIRTKAVNVLYAMSSLCGAFLRKRVIEEVWPCFVKTFKDLLPIATNHSNFRHTLHYKLLSTLIGQLPGLCTKLEISVGECETIIRWVISYMKIAPLEGVCEDVLCSFVLHDPDLMWLLMIQLAPNELGLPPTKDFPHFQLPKCTNISERQYSVILNVLQKCET